MAGVNKVMLIGRLGRDPEIRYSQQGTAMVNFSIATSEQWTDKNTGERQERTEWHRIVVFGKQAEICEKYLAKGREVFIEGRLQTRNYEKDGQTHYITEIVVSNVQFIGPKPTDDGRNAAYQQRAEASYTPDYTQAQNSYQEQPKSEANSDDTSSYQDQSQPGMVNEQTGIKDSDIPF